MGHSLSAEALGGMYTCAYAMPVVVHHILYSHASIPGKDASLGLPSSCSLSALYQAQE